METNSIRSGIELGSVYRPTDPSSYYDERFGNPGECPPPDQPRSNIGHPRRQKPQYMHCAMSARGRPLRLSPEERE